MRAPLRDDPHAFPCIFEDDVRHGLMQALSYATWALERIDPTFRLTHVAIGAHLDAGNYLSWRTRAEHEQWAGSVTIGRGETRHLCIVKPRSALRFEGAQIVEDFVVQMRRQRRDH